MKILTRQEQRSRLDSLGYAQAHVEECLRNERIHDYRPGQVIYNLGEYPAKFSIRPTEYDYNLIKSLSERGVGLIQVHEEWNDAIRILGADKFTSHDHEGMKEFIDLCHSFGIKILPYFSSGLLDVRDPDFRDEFMPEEIRCNDSSYYRYRCLDDTSPAWLEYIMNKARSILENYEFDGLFNDMGAIGKSDGTGCGYMYYDPYLDDLLARLYSLVKEYDGIVKIHQGYCLAPKSYGKIYDYLWIGEGVKSSETMNKVAQFDPYVVPCPDFRFLSEEEEEAFYAKTIPFMQFVLRVDGRPVTGERVEVPGVEYIYNSNNDEKLHFDKVKKWYDAHPDGPHVYSEWSSIPDNPRMREKWFEYLDLYRPMVEENSVAYIDITKSTITRETLLKNVHMSLFVNENCYLCVSNLDSKTQTIDFNDKWLDRQSGEIVQSVTIKPNKLKFLKLSI